MKVGGILSKVNGVIEGPDDIAVKMSLVVGGGNVVSEGRNGECERVK